MSVALLTLGYEKRIMRADNAAEIIKLLAASTPVNLDQYDPKLPGNVYTEVEETAVSGIFAMELIPSKNFVTLADLAAEVPDKVVEDIVEADELDTGEVDQVEGDYNENENEVNPHES